MDTKLFAGHLKYPFTTRAARKVLFIFFFFISCRSYGQSYFYFENKLSNHLGQPLDYFIFLTVQTDGTAIARIRFIDPISGEDKLIAQKFTDSSDQSIPDSTNPFNKYLIAADPPDYLIGTDDTSFIVPKFMFQKQVAGEDSLYVPVSVSYKVSGQKWVMAQMVANQQKGYDELSKQKDFVSHFFNEKDAFYAYLFTLDTRALTRLERSAKLFLIVVANTNDPEIGVSSKKDLDKITATFTTLKEQLGIPMIMQTISGDNYSKILVDDAINTLKPAPIDMVVFYYSGHGFRYTNETSDYPRISLRTSKTQDLDKNNLSIEDVYNRILKKSARVTIVLSDCCNDDIGAPVPVGKDPLRTKGTGIAGLKLNFDHCKALFFPDHPISVLSAAAQANQLSSGNPALGGFFTNFFQSQLVNSLYGIDGESSWLKILVNAKESTRKQALTAACGNGRCVQTATINVVPPL